MIRNFLVQHVRQRADCQRKGWSTCKSNVAQDIVSRRPPDAIRDRVPTVPLSDVEAVTMASRLRHGLRVFLPDDARACQAERELAALGSKLQCRGQSVSEGMVPAAPMF